MPIGPVAFTVVRAYLLSKFVQTLAFAASFGESRSSANERLAEFKSLLQTDAGCQARVGALRAEVMAFATQLPLPGLDL